MSEQQENQVVADLGKKLWETKGFHGARRVLAYETLHKIYTEEVDDLLLRGIKEESDSLFVDVRFVCLSRSQIFPRLVAELQSAWKEDPESRLTRRLVDILEVRIPASIGLDAAAVEALEPSLRAALRFRA